MEARHLLKQLKDDDWYLGDTEGACRQYVHPTIPGVITVCVRFSDLLGPDTLDSARKPADGPAAASEPAVAIEATDTGASAYSPDWTGCIATGDDEAEARDRLVEALELHRRGAASPGGPAST